MEPMQLEGIDGNELHLDRLTQELIGPSMFHSTTYNIEEVEKAINIVLKNQAVEDSNFEVLQQYLNKFEELADKVNSDQSQQIADLDKKLTDMQQQINDKINRIALGTDEDTIRLVVTAILQEQGVIK